MVVLGMDADNLPEPGQALRCEDMEDEKVQQVISQMGTTRSQVQQTEFAFLSPPTPRNKARFMNLSSIIQWMTMMLWLLRNPDAASHPDARIGTRVVCGSDDEASCGLGDHARRPHVDLPASSRLRRTPQGRQRRNRHTGIDLKKIVSPP